MSKFQVYSRTGGRCVLMLWLLLVSFSNSLADGLDLGAVTHIPASVAKASIDGVTDGPNPSGHPTIECVADDQTTLHTVTEHDNGRFTATDLSGQHYFDASGVVFDGYHDNGNFTPWPVKISAKVTEEFANEAGRLVIPETGETHHNFNVEILQGVTLVHFYVQFENADTNNNIYMKVTDPHDNGTFYNQATTDFETAEIDNPMPGVWRVRVAIKSTAVAPTRYWLSVDDDQNIPASGCWIGGTIQGAWDEHGSGVVHPDDGIEVTWEDPFHHSGAMTIQTDRFLIENVSVYNHGDGLRPYGDYNVIDGAYLQDIHDDCVENDDLYNLLVTDSFFDGCYVGFSARTHSNSQYNGSENVFEIRNSLVRLEPQPTVYKPEVYGEGPGHGQFFKWDDNEQIAIKLSLHNTIFLATQENRHGGGLGLEEISQVESCSNNIMVWTGEGPFPNSAELPSCIRLTTDIREWQDAVAAWHVRYPNRVNR